MEKKEYIPTELVEKLSAQGKAEPEIIQQLRSQGFTPSQINKALQQALKHAVEKPQPLLRPSMPTDDIPEKFRPTRRPEEIHSVQESPIEKVMVPPELHLAEVPVSTKEEKQEPKKEQVQKSEHIQKPVENVPKYERAEHQYPQRPTTSTVRPLEVSHEVTLEELVEQIVSEHGHKIEGSINEIEKIEKELQQRLGTLEEDFKSLHSSLDNNNKDFRKRLESTEDMLESFAARFEALENAFKDFSQFMKKK